jgi:hypothetical protein
VSRRPHPEWARRLSSDASYGVARPTRPIDECKGSSIGSAAPTCNFVNRNDPRPRPSQGACVCARVSERGSSSEGDWGRCPSPGHSTQNGAPWCRDHVRHAAGVVTAQGSHIAPPSAAFRSTSASPRLAYRYSSRRLEEPQHPGGAGSIQQKSPSRPTPCCRKNCGHVPPSRLS